jgi:hypothetical protein
MPGGSWQEFAIPRLGSDVRPKMVQTLLGYVSIVITLNTYSYVLPEMSNLAAEAMNRLLD